MKHLITCSVCETQNNRHNVTCHKCRSFIRERVVNLDVSSTLQGLLESPVKTYTNIIFAEHKNFISILLILVAIKLAINSKFLSLIANGTETVIINIPLLIIASLILLLLVIYLNSSLFTFFLKSRGVVTRLKDNFSLYSFSLFPFIFALIFLFIFEIILFGQYLFLLAPSPFDIKPVPAYIFLSLEVIFLLYTFLQTVFALYAQSLNKILSLFFSILFYLSLFYPLYLFSFLFYN